jgi:nucleoside-diphosphate-sugar epimerase
VHTDDLASAFCHATVGDARGAFNVAAEPVLDADRLAKLLHARKLPGPPGPFRGLASLAWRFRLQPMLGGWLGFAFAAPLMDTRRAREELGWKPRKTADEALAELREAVAVPGGPVDAEVVALAGLRAGH